MEAKDILKEEFSKQYGGLYDKSVLKSQYEDIVLRAMNIYAQIEVNGMQFARDKMDKLKNSLKGGEQLIFIRDGGVLSTSKGNVFTFANWFKVNDKRHPGKHYWQCQELLNKEHNFSIYDVELFDKTIHKVYHIMDDEILTIQQNAFKEKYGS